MWQKMRFFFLKCSCYFTLHPAPFSHSCWHRSAVLTPGTRREEEGGRPEEEEEDSNRAVSSLKHRSVSVSICWWGLNKSLHSSHIFSLPCLTRLAIAR